jgi:hypothetical protein
LPAGWKDQAVPVAAGEAGPGRKPLGPLLWDFPGRRCKRCPPKNPMTNAISATIYMVSFFTKSPIDSFCFAIIPPIQKLYLYHYSQLLFPYDKQIIQITPLDKLRVLI